MGYDPSNWSADDFDDAVNDDLEGANRAFKGEYGSELNALLGLSLEEIDKITPDTTDLEVYENLIAVVKQASARNIEQAVLKERIVKLGTIAVDIAKMVPSLASRF